MTDSAYRASTRHVRHVRRQLDVDREDAVGGFHPAPRGYFVHSSFTSPAATPTMEATQELDRDTEDKRDGDRDETPKERLDRNLTELVGELRVALPGVQVLFAFLLAVPFNQRFSQVSGFQKTVYLVTLLSTAASTAMLLAPSALHRLMFRQDDKKHIVVSANRYAIAGFGFLLVAVTGAVLLVTDFVYGDETAAIATAGVALVLLTFWYALPLARRITR
jgi:hypothetical protein